nr:protein HGH1 homolog [Onthophagus taurus]
MNEIDELVRFLQLGARTDLKHLASQQILGLTATNDGITTLIKSEKVLVSLITLLHDNTAKISKNAAQTLVNITSMETSIEILLNLDLRNDSMLLKSPKNIVETTLGFISDETSEISDENCMILANLTRDDTHIEKVLDLMLSSPYSLEKLVRIFSTPDYNRKGSNLDYLASVFLNLSQSKRFRDILFENSDLLEDLTSFLTFKKSDVRRRGVAGILKNCCFDVERHKWLLSEEFEILTKLLLPLMDGAEYDEEDNEKFPVELQFLDEGKERDQDEEVRCVLLESLNQLCALKENRKFIRDNNAYVVLRELHKWEKSPKVLLACENCVDILIRTEEEINADNLKDVNIPEDLKIKLDEIN